MSAMKQLMFSKEASRYVAHVSGLSLHDVAGSRLLCNSLNSISRSFLKKRLVIVHIRLFFMIQSFFQLNMKLHKYL